MRRNHIIAAGELAFLSMMHLMRTEYEFAPLNGLRRFEIKENYLTGRNGRNEKLFRIKIEEK